jgi:epimerase transport system membrane fusion protein
MTSEDLTDITWPLRVGLVLFALVFGVFGIWASVAPLDGAAHAFGRVTVASNSKTAQHLEGGIIAAILVKNGDFVKEGDLLIKLDETQSLAQLDIVRSQFNAFKLKEARLNAEKAKSDSVIYPTLEGLNQMDIDAENEVDLAQ